MIYLIVALYSIFGIAFFVGAVIYILPFFFGAPYVPSSNIRTKTIIKLLKPKRGEKIVDLGSGDGKLLFEIAKTGATAYGYEINPVLVLRTKIIAKRLGLSKNIKVETANFWNKDLSGFDGIVVYGITYVMPKLEKKILKETKPGTRIVSNYFSFPNIKPRQKKEDILLYKI